MDDFGLSSRRNTPNTWRRAVGVSGISVQGLLVAGFLGCAPTVYAGAYIFAGEANGIDVVTHPTGYTGTGGQLALNVCIVPGSPNAAAMEQSVRNIIAVYNQLLPTTGNQRSSFLASGQVDFESVALHELGHCLGQAHVNAASESGNPSSLWNYTKAADGANNHLDRNDGVDNVIGSSDDVRGDDINLHWYRTANNNPFTIDYSTVDSTTYARDTASLPSGHLFATNGDRTVGSSLLSTPNTEAVMQQGTFTREIQRTLTHDGVATLKYGMSGLDELTGIGDDYTYQLTFATSNCDINLSFDNAETGFAVCKTGGFFIGPSANEHVRISTADIFFNTGSNWFFNTATPCSETLALTQSRWTQITLPCSVGISTGNTVADVLGNDLGVGAYDTEWVVYERDAANNVNTKLATTDVMATGKGYWVFTNQAAQSFDVEGQFNGSPDILLHGVALGRQNLVGHPFDFSVDWADVQIVDGAVVKSLATATAGGSPDLSNQYNVWNGSAYQAFDDTPGGASEGTLTAFDGIWVKVFKDGIYLRVPSIVSAAAAPSTSAPSAVSSSAEESSSEQMTASQPAGESPGNKVGDDGSWYVRVIVESGDLEDPGNVLGQLPTSVDGQDKHDLEELAPFGSSYLTVVFPHEEWGGNAWGYTTDYHASTPKPEGEWNFAVLSSIDVSQVSLRLEGPESILRKAKLRDLETGKLVKFSKGAYTFDASPGERYFSFKLGKK